MPAASTTRSGGDQVLVGADAGDAAGFGFDREGALADAQTGAGAFGGADEGLHRGLRVGVAVACAERGGQDGFGHRRRDFADLLRIVEEDDVEAGGFLRVHQRADDGHFVRRAGEAEITAAAVVRGAVELLGEGLPDADGFAGKRQLGGVTAGLADAGEGPARGHRGRPPAVEQRDAEAGAGEFPGRRGPADAGTDDHDFGHMHPLFTLTSHA